MPFKSFGRRFALALSTGALSSLAFLAPIHAFAATPTQLHAVKPVFLRSAAHLGKDTVVKEPVGTAFTVESGSTSRWWHVLDSKGRQGYVIRNANWVVQSAGSARTSVSSAPNISALPPGVTMDPHIVPLAPRNASSQQKFQAILKIAQSKLGTPYRWGHNEDRGQYGFDCSNFTAYVYHHALGYKFSGASLVQARSVGWTIPKSSMQPGDLLIFNNGGHVGIYIGHNQMIEEGGGLGKVGYLSVGPNSYWGKHITAVKRMF